jgi:hypothetical protein
MLNESETRVVELRVKCRDDGKHWEERKVEATFLVAPDEENTLRVVGSSPELRLSEATTRLAKALYPEAIECRWNFRGNDQGHYQDC